MFRWKSLSPDFGVLPDLLTGEDSRGVSVEYSGSKRKPAEREKGLTHRMLEEARQGGRELSCMGPAPENGNSPWESMWAYDDLGFTRFSQGDEFRWLAEQIIEGMGNGGSRDIEVKRMIRRGNLCRNGPVPVPRMWAVKEV